MSFSISLGVCECQIRTIRKILMKLIQGQNFNDALLETFPMQCEATLNQQQRQEQWWVKQSITAGMRNAYLNDHATRKTYLAKQSEETAKEKKVLFTHKQKVKEATSQHKLKLRELCKLDVQRK